MYPPLSVLNEAWKINEEYNSHRERKLKTEDYIKSSYDLIERIKDEISSFTTELDFIKDGFDKINGKGKYRHRVKEGHDTLVKIKKYKEHFKNSPKDIQLLESMVIISDEELLLGNGIVVKIHCPHMQANDLDIFEKDGRYYFKHKKGLQDYLKMVGEDGFRLPEIETDEKGVIIRNEFTEIFDMIPGAGTPEHNEIICEMLNRSFGGIRDLDGEINTGSEAGFWSANKTSKNEALYCYLFHGISKIFAKESIEYGLGVLLIKRN